MKLLPKIALALLVSATTVIAEKRALIVGIPSTFHAGVRQGINIDIANMSKLLSGYGFKIDKIVDEDATLSKFRKKIKEYKNMKSDDTFVFYYSGHGGQVPDRNGDEDDNLDEVSVLHNKELLLDDELYSYLVDIPANKFVFFDSCHSGTAYKSASSADVATKSLGLISDYKKGIGFVSLEEPSKSEKKSILYFAAAGDTQSSLVTPSGSMFTLALIDGIKRHKADADANGLTTFDELLRFSIQDIKRQAQKCPPGQCPVFTPEIHGKQKVIKQDVLTAMNSRNKDSGEDGYGDGGYSTIEADLDDMISQGEAQTMTLMSRDSYIDGDKVELRFDSGSYRGYLSVIYIDNEDITVLYPNKYNPVEERYNGHMNFPSDITDKFKLTAMKPYGRTVVYTILSEEPLGLYEDGGKSLFKVMPHGSAAAKSFKGVMVQENHAMMIGKTVFTVEGGN